MQGNQRIKQSLDRVEGIFKAKPHAARSTKSGRATLKQGLLCEYTEDGKTLLADMPEPLGGDSKGLSPGGYARASLSMCLAIGYAMRAAQRGVRLHKVEVDIEADSDVSGLFGAAAAPYGEFRYRVRIESDAPEEAVRALVEEGDLRSPVLHAFREPQRVVRTVEISRPAPVQPG